jgi:hypothetical protein
MPDLRTLIVRAGISGLFLLGSSLCMAGSTYYYTGNDFTSFSGSPGVSTLNFVSASLTFASALPDNFSDTFPDPGATLPTSWSITDGVHTYSSADGDSLNYLELETDSNGAIDSWHVIGCDPISCPNGDLITASDDPNDPGYVYDVYGDLNTGDLAYVANEPGTWSDQAPQAPEPATFISLSIGALVIIAWSRVFRRRRT